MKLIKFIILLIILLVLSVSAFSQEAQKIDEFGNLNCDDYLSRMDNFHVQLNNFPDAKGYIFVYEGKLENAVYNKNGKFVENKYLYPKIGEAKARIKTMQQRLRFSRFPPERIVFIEAGLREKYTVEYWIVPNEADPPAPTLTLERIKHRRGKPGNFCGEF